MENKNMKKILTRGALAAALALSLASCGGGKATFTIGGLVQGLKYGPVVLTTNGQDKTVMPKSTNGEDVTYSFDKQLEYGDEYLVTVKTQPPHQTCSGMTLPETAGRLSSITVLVGCVDTPHTIGGSVTGLTKGTLVLANGSTAGTRAIASTDTTNGTLAAYTLPNTATWNQTYGVTVLTQPEGLTCTVANGTGVMGDENVTNVNVTCVPNP
ncbi:MAG TPA: hypothetical protein VNT33_13650 [Telluria sp.]|nr:hypothetical protein [Telluria sp.]